MLHAAVVRSPYAHARITSVDTASAKAMPGVRAVVTGAEAAEIVDPLPDSGPAPEQHVLRVLAVDKVRYVGEGVAVVFADTRYLAEDARDMVLVDYEPLEVIADPLVA